MKLLDMFLQHLFMAVHVQEWLCYFYQAYSRMFMDGGPILIISMMNIIANGGISVFLV